MTELVTMPDKLTAFWCDDALPILIAVLIVASAVGLGVAVYHVSGMAAENERETCRLLNDLLWEIRRYDRTLKQGEKLGTTTLGQVESWHRRRGMLLEEFADEICDCREAGLLTVEVD